MYYMETPQGSAAQDREKGGHRVYWKEVCIELYVIWRASSQETLEWREG